MSLLVKCTRQSANHAKFQISNVSSVFWQQLNTQPNENAEEQFKPLNLKHVKGQMAPKRKYKKAEVLGPRFKQMGVEQDWGSVWPGPKTFHPASVPLPLHQGYVEKGASPGKYANLELMKIPNFLHLTPPVIKRQCEALKKFCTAWPQELHQHDCHELFPLEVIKSDYCHSSASVREPLARIVSLKVEVSRLQLDEHARDKLLRLVGERYDADSDTLTIVADRCPTSKQNYEYALYLLTAVYFESWKVERWEADKSLADMERYDWEGSASSATLHRLASFRGLEPPPADLQRYRHVVSSLWNQGESPQMIAAYNEAVRKLLAVPSN